MIDCLLLMLIEQKVEYHDYSTYNGGLNGWCLAYIGNTSNLDTTPTTMKLERTQNPERTCNFSLQVKNLVLILMPDPTVNYHGFKNFFCIDWIVNKVLGQIFVILCLYWT